MRNSFASSPQWFSVYMMKTEDKIIEAFLLLLETTPVESITISLICKEANISRVTFYSYFSNLSSIFSFLVFDRFMQNKINPYPNIKEALRGATNFIVRHDTMFKRILTSPQREEFADFLKHQGMKHHDRWLAKIDKTNIIPQTARVMMGRFYSAGLIEMMFHWVDSDFNPAKNEFTEHAYLFLKGYIELAIHNFNFYKEHQKLPNREDIFHSLDTSLKS